MAKKITQWKELNNNKSSASYVLDIAEDINKELKEIFITDQENEKGSSIDSPLLGSTIFILGKEITK